jgi:pimeloyl-ACP methyl ester carboxylesterase
MEVPVMLAEVLTKIISYTPEAMKKGSMWWWILPLAPDVLKRLIVGHEREFLTWFYEGATAKPASIEPAAIDEYLRSFSGVEGVLGAHGVYRAAFTTMDQTAPLTLGKVQLPVIALGGDKSLGDKVQQMVAMVADSVEGHTLADCGHFIPEEQPEEVMTYIRRLAEKAARSSPAVHHSRPLMS